MSGARGRVMVKVAPSPGRLAAVRCPCMASAKARARGRPIPVPSIAVCSASSRSNGSKMRVQVSGQYSRPGVGYRQAGLAGAGRLAGNGNGSAGAVVLDRVGDQVDQDLPQPLPVGADGQAGPWAGLADRDRAVGREGSHELAGFLDYRLHGHRLYREAELARFDPGDVDQLVDQGEQVAPGSEDALDGVPVLAAELGQLQQLSETEDRVQRGAQLVAGAGQERVLRLGTPSPPHPWR